MESKPREVNLNEIMESPEFQVSLSTLEIPKAYKSSLSGLYSGTSEFRN